MEVCIQRVAENSKCHFSECMLLFSSVLPVFLLLIMLLAKTKTTSCRRCNRNDLLDSFVLFIFQGVRVNSSRYNLTFYTVYLYLA